MESIDFNKETDVAKVLMSLNNAIIENKQD